MPRERPARTRATDAFRIMAGSFVDPYTDPHTGVLHNKVRIRSAKVLQVFEYEQSAVRAVELREQPVQGRFDLAHLRAIHKALFQDVYDWAGELRTVNISKGGSSFVRNSQIEATAKRMAEGLEREKFLQGLPKDAFVDRLAHHYAQWNQLHPFREGNGRSTREFLGQLARQAGYELDQTRIDRAKGEWNLAAKLSFEGELDPLKALFSEAIRPLRAVAFEKLPKDEAVARHPELQGAYRGLEAMRESLAERFPGNEKAQAHYFAQARTEVQRKLETGQVLQTPPERSAARAAPTKSLQVER
jgi:cell filamentation protein